jgi:MipA family protein
MPPFFSLGTRPEQDIVAAGVLYFDAPQFAGSDQKRVIIVPSGTVFLTNGWFADVVNGIGRNFSTDARFEYGPRASFGVGREETDAIRGLGKIKNALDLGGFANWNVTERFQMQSSLRYGSGYDRDGLLVDVGAAYDVVRFGPASLTVDTSVSFANASYMRSFYGVSAGQSIASGIEPYRPGAGRQWSTAGISLTTPLHAKVLAVVSLEYAHLVGPAASSPYVRRITAPSLEATIVYGF